MSDQSKIVSYEKRLERIMALVKLGSGHEDRGTAFYPLIIKGRAVYGSDKYHRRAGGNKTMVLVQHNGVWEVHKMVDNDSINEMPYWIQTPAKFAELVHLAFWGTI